MKTYIPPLGVGVDDVLKAMVEIADATRECVTARFNGTTLIASPGDDFVVLAAQWWKEAEAAHEAWKKERDMPTRGAFRYPAEEWRDEQTGEWWRTCSNCWRSLADGEEHEAGTCEEPGRCGGCGRYGPYGKPCFRPCYEEGGQMEECGEFV